jgi:hypothetical protein
MRIHIGLVHTFITLLELLIVWIPIKLLAFNKAKTNDTAAAIAYGL